MSTTVLKGWKFGVLVGALVGGLGLFLYPIAISPMIDASEYKKKQRETRAGIKQEDVQPGGMKVWTDPFGRPKEKDQ